MPQPRQGLWNRSYSRSCASQDLTTRYWWRYCEPWYSLESSRLWRLSVLWPITSWAQETPRVRRSVRVGSNFLVRTLDCRAAVQLRSKVRRPESDLLGCSCRLRGMQTLYDSAMQHLLNYSYKYELQPYVLTFRPRSSSGRSSAGNNNTCYLPTPGPTIGSRQFLVLRYQVYRTYSQVSSISQIYY